MANLKTFISTLAQVVHLPRRVPATPGDPVPVADLRDGPAPTVDEMETVTSAPRLGSVRNEMSMGVARGLNPQRLANLLKAAEEGDPDAYLSLAEEIEERDLHYLSVLGTRKRQVAQLPMTLAAASKDEIDQAIAKDVQENIVDKGILDRAAFDALDATGKGFSLHELVWDTHSQPGKWLIDCLEWVNPRFVRHDRETMRRPGLLDNAGQRQELAQYKFAYLELKAKSGLAIRSGLARAVAWAYMFKNFAIKDWVQFCEVYGIPWRIGSYDSSATEAQKDALLRAVCSLASDAAAIKDKNMDIDIKESGATTASSALFGDLAKYFDDQVSKVVLGQTRTVDADGGGLNNGDAGTHVREDIERADAKALELCFNRDIIRVYVLLNYGPQAKAPYLTIGRPEQKDVAQMVDAAVKLVPFGLKLRASDFYEAIGFAQPQENDEVLVAPAPVSPFGLPAPANDPQQMQAAMGATRVRAELLAQELEGGADAIAIAARQQAIEASQVLAPVVKEVMRLAALSANESEFRRRLAAYKPDADVTPLADQLARLTFQTLAGGIVGDTLRH